MMGMRDITLLRQAVFHLGRDLGVFHAADEAVGFQLLEICAKGLVGNGFQIPFQLIESHRLKLVLYHLTFS